MSRQNFTWFALFLVALAFFGWAITHNFTEPWVMNDSYYGAHYSQAAHNFLRAGILKTGGVPAGLYAGPLPIPTEEFYVHHPTLFPLTVTAAFAIFGESEWAARLGPVLYSLFSAVLLWSLVKSCAGARAAALSVVAMVTMPMELHYGDIVDFEPLQTMLILAALVAMRRWQSSGRMLWRVLMFVAFFFAVWTEWLGYLFTSLVAGSLFFGKGIARDRRTAGILALIVLASLALFLLQIRTANPEAWQNLGDALHRRLGAGDLHGGSFTFSDWLRVTRRYLRTFFLAPHWLLGGAGVILLFFRSGQSNDLRWLGWATACMALMDLIFAIGLRNQSFVHDFAWFYLCPSFAIVCGLALDAMVETSSPVLNQPLLRIAGAAVLALLLATMGIQSYRRSAQVDTQFDILDLKAHEPYRLIPELGKTIASAFAPNATVLCNFDLYGSPLFYYAQHSLLTGITTIAEWKTIFAEERNVVGVIWPEEAGARKILAGLPASEQKPVKVCGVKFVLWTPKTNLRKTQ